MRFLPRESKQFWSMMDLTASVGLVQSVQREIKMRGNI